MIANRMLSDACVYAATQIAINNATLLVAKALRSRPGVVMNIAAIQTVPTAADRRRMAASEGRRHAPSLISPGSISELDLVTTGHAAGATIHLQLKWMLGP